DALHPAHRHADGQVQAGVTPVLVAHAERRVSGARLRSGQVVREELREGHPYHVGDPEAELLAPPALAARRAVLEVVFFAGPGNRRVVPQPNGQVDAPYEDRHDREAPDPGQHLAKLTVHAPLDGRRSERVAPARDGWGGSARALPSGTIESRSATLDAGNRRPVRRPSATVLLHGYLVFGARLPGDDSGALGG